MKRVAVEPVAGNTRETQPENRKFYPALDGYRAVAFLLVFAHHYLLLPWGHTGVDAFFVLSGFLITGILYDTRDDPNRARTFYIRRTLRIFPLYYGVMLLIVIAYPVMHWVWSWKWLVWPAYVGNYARFFPGYVPGSMRQLMADAQLHSLAYPKFTLYLGHFWSLCVEEQFYLVWPWVVFWVKDRRVLLWICALSVPVCTALRVLHGLYLPSYMYAQEVTLRATPLRLDALLVGGWIALMLRGPSTTYLFASARAVAVGFLLAFGLWHVFGGPGLRHYHEYQYTWALTPLELFYGAIVVIALQPRSVLYRVLKFEPLRWLGRITYGAYVFHDLFHPEFERLGFALGTTHPRVASAAIALLATVLLSWMSFRWFETPFIRLKDRWT